MHNFKDKIRGRSIIFLLLLSTLLSTALNADFNFGECSGSGTFEQQIVHYVNDYENTTLVGQIPQGIEGLRIELISDKDVDIRLYGENEDKIVHWPYGLLSHSYQQTEPYNDVPVTYSGYNGVEGEKGHEFIEVNGTTPTTMTMKAFGYKAGYATVNYSWTGKVGCTSSDNGTGSFTQALEQNATTLVGTIPPNVENVQINLTSETDLDIQLYGADGTAIASWKPMGLMAGPIKQSTVYHGMNITWSGYNGTDGQAGHEYIKIAGNTTEVLVMKVFGYEAGEAEVDYSWGDANTTDDYNVILAYAEDASNPAPTVQNYLNIGLSTATITPDTLAEVNEAIASSTTEEIDTLKELLHVLSGTSACLSREELDTMIDNDENVTQVNTKCITDMSHLFEGHSYFNQPIGNWDVSNVTDMSYMFKGVYGFNQPIDNWDVSNVANHTGFAIGGSLDNRFNPFVHNMCNTSTEFTLHDVSYMSFSRIYKIAVPENFSEGMVTLKFDFAGYSRFYVQVGSDIKHYDKVDILSANLDSGLSNEYNLIKRNYYISPEVIKDGLIRLDFTLEYPYNTGSYYYEFTQPKITCKTDGKVHLSPRQLSLAKIIDYAEDSSNPIPTEKDYTDIGVYTINSGNYSVTEDVLAQMNQAVANSTKFEVDTVMELRDIFGKIINNSEYTKKQKARSKIVAYSEDSSNPTPTLQDYKDAGVHSITAEYLNEMNEAVSNAAKSEVDTLVELNAILEEINPSSSKEQRAQTKIEAYAEDSSSPIPTLQDYKDAGISSMTWEYLEKVNEAINAASWTDVNSASKLKQFILDIIHNPCIDINELKLKIQNNEDVTQDDTSCIDDMSGLFQGNATFNQDISGWDVSAVTNMSNMFSGASTFNQPIGSWDVSSVTNMSHMFDNADAFDQPIGDWDVASVTNMSHMFNNADAFDQPIGKWDVSNVTTMSYMFADTGNFSDRYCGEGCSSYVVDPIDDWDTSSVIDMRYMFANTPHFTGNKLSVWHVNLVEKDMHVGFSYKWGVKNSEPVWMHDDHIAIIE